MYKLFTDGGSRGNPGISACAYVLLDSTNELVDINGKFLGTNTNNHAEYNGLINGLQSAIKNNIKTLDCFLDSELVVKQVKGEYKVNNENIIELHKKVKSMLEKFDSITFNYIPRANNKIADKLVNVVLDAVSQ